MEVLRFGLFELEPSSGELKRSGVPVKLQLQPGKVLALLASEPGRLFTREEIQARVWGTDTQVDFEQGLNYCIKEIRAALGDRADNPAYVETLARRGYRFIAPVDKGGPAPEPSLTPTGTAPAPPRGANRVRSRWPWVAVVLALVGLVLGGATVRRSARSGRLVVAVLPFENSTGDSEYELFTSGLTEEMQLQLGRLQPSQLTVIARTTTRGYAKRPHPIAALVQDLDVDYVLEGMVRHCAKHARVRITARLVRAADRREIWSDHLHEPMDDGVVDVQRHSARVLAAGAGAALARREPSKLTIEVRSADSATPW